VNSLSEFIFTAPSSSLSSSSRSVKACISAASAPISSGWSHEGGSLWSPKRIVRVVFFHCDDQLPGPAAGRLDSATESESLPESLFASAALTSLIHFAISVCHPCLLLISTRPHSLLSSSSWSSRRSEYCRTSKSVAVDLWTCCASCFFWQFQWAIKAVFSPLTCPALLRAVANVRIINFL